MALKDSLTELLTPAVTAQGYYLEEVLVANPGKHRIITCIIDGDQSLNLDQVTAVTRAISELLDETPLLGELPFTLEVTSPGVDRPLTLPRHFAKNLDRLVKITKSDGSEVSGRITASSEVALTILLQSKKESQEVTLPFSEIKKAKVEIEFNRKGE